MPLIGSLYTQKCVLSSDLLLKAGPSLKSYPSMLLCTTLQSFLSTIESFIIAIALERDHREWKLGWNVRLLIVAYCGNLVRGITFCLQSWVIEKKGPVFQAMWTPLVHIFTICSSAVLFGEIISLENVLGAILLVVGLYSVLRGKTKEQSMEEEKCASTTCTHKNAPCQRMIYHKEALQCNCLSQILARAFDYKAC